MYLNLNNHTIYYEEHGPQTGPVVILLHHGLGSLAAWEEQIPALAKAGYRVIAYDRWGYGGSDPRERLSVPHFEDDLADLLGVFDTLEIPTASLIGHSDGGTLSLYFAGQHPERVERMVIVAAHIYVEPKMLPGIEGLRSALAAEPKFQEGMRRAHGDKWECVFWNWYTGWVNEAIPSWDMRPSLGKISCPVMVVQGLQDEHATPRHAEDLAGAIPGAKLWLVENGLHMLPREMPAEFNQRVLEFLAPVHDFHAIDEKDERLNVQ